MKKADITIKEHQEFIIEQERLKSLLQMSVATTHELGQPLTVLLGNIELMGIYKDNPEKLAQCITKIKEAGKRIATIIKKGSEHPPRRYRAISQRHIWYRI